MAAANDNKGAKWTDRARSGYDYYIRFNFRSSVPTGNWRSWIVAGANAWNNVGRELYFAWHTTNPPDVWVQREDLLFPNGDAWAIATRHPCVIFVTTCGGSIAFNTTPAGFRWYTGTSTTVPSTQGDLWSVAAHEWGHLVEMEHSSASADTMHGIIAAGTSSKRSLTTHDKSGFLEMYADH